MYPILFRIGNFPINTYGVFLALAFLGAIFVTVRLAERDGLPREKIYDLCLWLLLSSLIGSDRKSTRLNSSHVRISYAVFCLKKKMNRLCHLLKPREIGLPNSSYFTCRG